MAKVCINSGPRCCAAVLALCLLIMAGCSSVRRTDLSYEDLTACYRGTVLQQSSSLDVLRTLQASGQALDPKALGRSFISQSDTTIASCGQTKDANRGWFSLFVFGVTDLTAERKYSLYLDEKAWVAPTGAKRTLFPGKRVLVFDCEVLLKEAPAGGPSDLGNRIALVGRLSQGLGNDLGKFSPDRKGGAQSSSLLMSYGMLMNQVFRDVLVTLDRSPVIAMDMDSPKGLEFQQASFDTGRIWVKGDGERAVVHIELGLPPKGDATRQTASLVPKKNASKDTKKGFELHLPKLGNKQSEPMTKLSAARPGY